MPFFKGNKGMFTAGKGLLSRTIVVLIVILLAATSVFAALEVLDPPDSWDEGANKYENGNVSIAFDGTWKPFYVELDFDNDEHPDACGAGTSTPWAGEIEIGLYREDNNPAGAPGFVATRDWKLVSCDRNNDGAVNSADKTYQPKTAFTPYGDPPNGGGPSDLQVLSQDVYDTSSCGGNCEAEIVSRMFVNLDLDCDGQIDEPMPETGICLAWEGQSPNCVDPSTPGVACEWDGGTSDSFWGGNFQARVNSGGGDKTLNFDVRDEPIVPPLTGPPFSCTDEVYVSLGDDSTPLFELDDSTSPYTLTMIGDDPGVIYNAIGYYRFDNYIYGIHTSDNHLVRVDANGDVHDMGTVSGLPGGSYYAGGTDGAGNYIVQRAGVNPRELWAIDLSTRPATATSLGAITIPLFHDLAWDPVTGGWFTVTESGQVYKLFIDIPNGSHTSAHLSNIPAMPGGHPYGGIWTDGNDINAYRNNGEVYKIILTASPPQWYLMSPAPSISSNDATNCVFEPVLALLSDLEATCSGGSLLISWTTAMEFDNEGFNVLRAQSAGGEAVRVNPELIPSQGPTSQGHSYEYLDTSAQPDTEYWYWIEDVDVSGATSVTGPVSVSGCEAPTAVTLSSMDASGEAPNTLLPGLVAAGALGILAAGVLLRRRLPSVG
ncbi:MAG: hypothetical protein U9R25_17845 [Chloroflexota bacterium]|nr:hypothetical protein [Chloroflexota bacterium]